MTAEQVRTALRRHFHDAWMHMPNTYVLGWEADYLCLVDKLYWCEVEVKISRADFKRDFTHKPDKHRALINAHRLKRGWWVRQHDPYQYPNYVPCDDGPGQRLVMASCTQISYQHVPHRFYFACPENLIQPAEVPKYAGLIWILSDGKCKLVKRPVTLHQQTLDIMQAVATKQHFMIDALQRQVKELQYQLEKPYEHRQSSVS